MKDDKVVVKQAVSKALRGGADTESADAMWDMCSVLGESSHQRRNPLPRGRMVESVCWLELLFPYITTKLSIGVPDLDLSEVRVPLTLVFRYTRPHTWFERRAGSILEFPVSDNIEEIIQRFKRASLDLLGGPILAVYTYSKSIEQKEDGNKPPRTQLCTEYFDENLLRDFLKHRPSKNDGIVQQFFAPAGDRSTAVKCHLRAGKVAIEGRTNVYSLSDTRRGLQERAVTFDGAEHESRSRRIADGALYTTASRQVRLICQHLERLLPHQYEVMEAKAYFRPHPNGKLYLLNMPCISLGFRSSGTPVPTQQPVSPRMCSPQFSHLGQLPRELFRCPTCSSTVRAQLRTAVPFKSILLHVTQSDLADGVEDGDSEAIRRLSSSLDKVGSNTEYWSELYREAERQDPSRSTLHALKSCGYPGGDFDLDDKLENEAEVVCCRLLQTAMRTLGQAQYKWIRDHRPRLFYRIYIFCCSDCSLEFSSSAMNDQNRSQQELGGVDKTPSVGSKWAKGCERQEREHMENQLRKSRSLPLLPRRDRAAEVKSRPWRAAQARDGEGSIDEAPRFDPVLAIQPPPPATQKEKRSHPGAAADGAEGGGGVFFVTEVPGGGGSGAPRRPKVKVPRAASIPPRLAKDGRRAAIGAPPTAAQLRERAQRTQLASSSSLPFLPAVSQQRKPAAGGRLWERGGATGHGASAPREMAPRGREEADKRRFKRLADSLIEEEILHEPGSRALRDAAGSLSSQPQMQAMLDQRLDSLNKAMARLERKHTGGVTPPTEAARGGRAAGSGGPQVDEVDVHSMLDERLTNLHDKVDQLEQTIRRKRAGTTAPSAEAAVESPAAVESAAAALVAPESVVAADDDDGSARDEGVRPVRPPPPLNSRVVALRATLGRELFRVLELFKEIDVNEGGRISRKEFRKAFPMLRFAQPGASKGDMDALFDALDYGGSGQLKYADLPRRV